MKPSALSTGWLLLAAFAVWPLPARAADAAVPPVTTERFLPQISAQLAAHFRLEGDLQVDLLRNWVPPATPATTWEMRVVGPPANLAPQGIVRVRLVADGRNLGEWNLPVRLQHWVEGLATREPVGRGDVLATLQFDLRRVDALREKDAVPAGTALDHLAVTRPVPAGALLTWRDLHRRPLVQRGERIEVVATDGALTITLKGQAMQSGALGETILVRNTDSRRDFTAVVTGENRARVAFAP